MTLSKEELIDLDFTFQHQSESVMPPVCFDFLSRFLVYAASLDQSNRVCHAGIFTGNDLNHLHNTYLQNNILVDAFDSYPYLSSSDDKALMHQYVSEKHADKTYTTFYWSDVLTTTNNYSVIYNTAGTSIKIETLSLRQNSPSFIVNLRGSSWHLPLTDLKWVFRCSSNFDIYCNTDEAVTLFEQFIKSVYTSFYRRDFPIRLVHKPYLWGNVNMTSEYKKLVKKYSSNYKEFSI